MLPMSSTRAGSGHLIPLSEAWINCADGGLLIRATTEHAGVVSKQSNEVEQLYAPLLPFRDILYGVDYPW